MTDVYLELSEEFTLHLMMYPVIGNSPLGTVGGPQDTLITPRLLTATALTVCWLGLGGAECKDTYQNIIQAFANYTA